MRAAEFVTLLRNVRRSGARYMACCPAHDDATPSLSIKDGDDRILLHDFGQNCSSNSIVAAVGLTTKDLFHNIHNRGNGFPRTAPVLAVDQLTNRLEFIESTPTPLPPPLPPVPELDPEMIPGAIRPWVEDIAARMQCPIEFPAIAALTATGAVVGNRVVMKPKAFDTWIEIPNVWGAGIGEPGVMKSPAVAEALGFVKEIENAEMASFAEHSAAYAFEKEARDAEKKQIRRELEQVYKPRTKKSAEEIADVGINIERLRKRFEELETVVELKPTRLWTSDATTEKLGELLNENPRGIFNIRDELSGIFEMLGKPGREGDRQFLLEAWNGRGEFNVDRIGRGSIRINNLTLSIFGTIQPAVIDRFLRDSIAKGQDDGFIQRFQLLAYPDTKKSYTYVDREPRGVDAARSLFRALYNFEPGSAGLRRLTEAADGYFYLEFDTEAQRFFESWLIDLETSLRDGSFVSPLMRAHMSKFRGLMPCLALIFQLVDSLSQSTSMSYVTYENAVLAAEWCSFLQRHAERLYGMAVGTELSTARSILDRINDGQIGHKFDARSIYRKCWSGLSVPKAVNAGLDVLVEYGWLLKTQTENGGTQFIVHEGKE